MLHTRTEELGNRVQVWKNGIMMTILDREEASIWVDNGEWFIINSQAITNGKGLLD